MHKMPDMFRVKIVYIHSQTPNYVRVHKNLELFSRLFPEVHYLGCLRGNPWVRAAALPRISYHIYGKSLPHGPQSIFGALGFYGYIKKCVEKISPQLVIATNEDFIFPFVMGYIKRPRYLVCDLIDSLAIRINSPLRIFSPQIKMMSELLLKKIDALIEVNEERLSLHRNLPRLHTVIYNSPPWVEKVDPYPGLPAPAIYVSGSIVDGRSGIETLLPAVEKVPEMNIIFAGRYAGNWMAKVFLKHPKVKYLGEVTPGESLRIAKACKAIFAFYAPIIPNFVYAAPNKLYEAMMLGVPILMNSECKAGETAQRYGIGLLSPYDDVMALKKNILYLLEDDPKREENCRMARERFRNVYSWEKMQERYVRLFRSMTIPEIEG